MACLLVVAGHDPSGGAGVAADARAARAMGVAVHTVVTAWTEQSLDSAWGWRANPHFAASLSSAPGCDAMKIGMVGTGENLRHLLAFLEDFEGPVVMDPVLATSSGMDLWEGSPAELLQAGPHVDLITPNLPELAALTDTETSSTPHQAIAQARKVLAHGFGAVLVKGGHAEGEPLDLLVTSQGVTEYRGSRISGSYRGTGCWLASAIASLLALGRDLQTAVGIAKEELTRRLVRAREEGLRYVP